MYRHERKIAVSKIGAEERMRVYDIFTPAARKRLAEGKTHVPHSWVLLINQRIKNRVRKELL